MKRKKAKKINYDKLALKVFFGLVIITLLILSCYLIEVHLIKNKSSISSSDPVLGTTSEVTPSSEDIAFWKDYLARFPKYFPGWIELARLESETGNFTALTEDVKKAEELNPNSKEVKELKFHYGL